MLEYFNETYRYEEILERTGGMSQLAGARRFIFAEGRAKGTEAIDVRTGSGLSFMVLPDRGMDIAWAEFKGINLSYISPTGVVAPAYYESRGTEWLRGFYAGLMTTCGLTQAGPPLTKAVIRRGASTAGQALFLQKGSRWRKNTRKGNIS